MWKSFVDKLYGKDFVVKWLKARKPDEEIAFVSAATILETNDDMPVGLSIERFFQKRGILVITRNQILLKGRTFSLMTIVYFFLLVYSLASMFAESDWLFLIPAVFFCAGIAQRWSFEKHIRLDDIQDVKKEEVIFMRGKYPIIMIYLAGKVIQIVTSQIPNQDILQMIKPSKK